ncbi:MAG: hypothetical protein IJP27_09845 [Clostridia bacterium]|nr:hypothetical protein [Clostridia bacterium]
MIRIPKIHYNYTNDPFARRDTVGFPSLYGDTRFLYEGYTVTVNGKPCPVRACRESAIPFNQPWPGYQRPLDQTEEAGYITFSADEEVTLRVECAAAFERATVRPLSKAVEVRRQENVVEFTLKEHGGYVLELDDYHHCLHVFYNPIKVYSEKATYHFGPGIHFVGVLELKDNESVYIDEEAIVFGSINSLGAENIRIFGGGVLHGGSERRIFEHCYENFTKGTIRLYNSKNIVIEDVILQDSATWILSLFNCSGVVIDGIKTVGHWRYNTDGIDVVNTSDVLIKNSFIRSFDDTVTLKAIYGYDRPVENIVTEHCVLWCGWGRNCEIGLETDAPEYRNIVFRDCDLIHNSKVAIDIQNGSGGEIHDILFEDLRVEYQTATLPEIVQRAADQTYAPHGMGVPALIVAENRTFHTYTKFGDIHDITYRNIRIFAEDGVPAPAVRFQSRDPQVVFCGFTVENVTWNGKAVSMDFFDGTVENAKEIQWKN